MKKLLIITTVLFAAIAANAESLHPETFVRVSELKQLNLDATQFAGRDIQSATVSVNEATQTAVLTLNEMRPICPKPMPGFFSCMAIGKRLVETVIELPIVSIETGSCGATIYTAKEDNRMVDGNLQVLEIVDNTTMTCKIAIHPDRMTSLVYEVETSGFGGNVQTFESTAFGTALESPFSVVEDTTF